MLDRLTAGEPLNFARGVRFTGELLDELLAASPIDEGRPVLRDADFDKAAIQIPNFRGVTFQGNTSFNGATFLADARFDRARFQGATSFSGASFYSPAFFTHAIFEGAAQLTARFESDAEFERVTFSGDARFNGVFEERASFAGASFQGATQFVGTQFQYGAVFKGSRFHGDALFTNVTVKQEAAEFTEVRFHGDALFSDVTVFDAKFSKARFHGDAWFGPLKVHRKLDLDDTLFAHPVRFEVEAVIVSGRRLRLENGGGLIRLSHRDGRITLDEAILTQPVTIIAMRATEERQHAIGDAKIRPLVNGLRRVDASNLVLSDVDLRICHFTGAYNLDRLRIEGPAPFALSPAWWTIAWGWPPIWRWSSRQVLVEEREWRAFTSRGAKKDGWLLIDYRRDPQVLGAEQIAALYRQLRKAQEDAKNEPGAADFYYGECEMRRLSPNTSIAERGILWLYWLTSGYGLRAWRALACLALLITAVALALHQVGFVAPAAPSLGTVLVFAAESVVSLESKLHALGNNVTLTASGEVLRLVLRVLGPVLLGLTALSIRNRIKR